MGRENHSEAVSGLRQHSSALTLMAPFAFAAGCLLSPRRHQHNSPCLMDVGRFEEKITENFNFFFFPEGFHTFQHLPRMQLKVCRQSNLPSPEEMMHHQLPKVSSSLVGLHQPVRSHDSKDHRICPVHFQRQLWKGQLARKEKRERFCFSMSPWRVGSPGKRKYQPGTVSAAFRTSLWPQIPWLWLVPITLQRHWQALAG